MEMSPGSCPVACYATHVSVACHELGPYEDRAHESLFIRCHTRKNGSRSRDLHYDGGVCSVKSG